MISTILYFAKHFFIFFVLFVVCYVAYWFLYKPISKRRHFSKYPQVWVNEKFNFMFGDYTDLKKEYEDQGKFIGSWFKDKPVKSM